MMNHESEEVHLLTEIGKTPHGPRRDALIRQLEQAPVDSRVFYQRWLLIHNVEPFWDCWSDEGYHPLNSHFPRDVQILAAADYGKAEIDNGGFHQFFGNGTGVFAPELTEWLDRVGLKEAATSVSDAMAVFGDNYPRSQLARQELLTQFERDSRDEWDPFTEMDSRFYDTASDEVFFEAADRWLRDVCKMTRLQSGS